MIIPALQRQNLLQVIITLLLTMILLAMVGVYIFVGMNRAQLSDPSIPTIVGEVPQTTNLDLTEVETAEINRRMKILDELVAESQSSSTLAERVQQLSDLVNEDQINLDETSRYEVLYNLEVTQNAVQ